MRLGDRRSLSTRLHAWRNVFELTDIAASERRGKSAPPISLFALEVVKRTDLLFDIKRGIDSNSAAERLAERRERSVPALADLKGWMQAGSRELSCHSWKLDVQVVQLFRLGVFTCKLANLVCGGCFRRATRGLRIRSRRRVPRWRAACVPWHWKGATG